MGILNDYADSQLLFAYRVIDIDKRLIIKIEHNYIWIIQLFITPMPIYNPNTCSCICYVIS